MDSEVKVDLTKELQTKKNTVATAILGMRVQRTMLEYYISGLEQDNDRLGLLPIDPNLRREGVKSASSAPVNDAYVRYEDFFKVYGLKEKPLPQKDFEAYVLDKIDEKILDPASVELGALTEKESDSRIGEMLLAVCGERTDFDEKKYGAVQKTMLESLARNGINLPALRHLRGDLFRIVQDMRLEQERKAAQAHEETVDELFKAAEERAALHGIRDKTEYTGAIPGRIDKKKK